MDRKRPKMLVVDDEPDICKFVKSYFSKRGIIVSTAFDGEEALSILKTSKPDIILLDVKLGELDGIEVLRRLRKFNKESKVVIITGQTFPKKKIEKIISIGATTFLHKPLILDEVAKVVYSLIEDKPLPPIKKKRKQPQGRSKTPRGPFVHELANLLGIIRNKCENFTSNVEDDMYRIDTKEECCKVIDKSCKIYKEIIETVDRATEVVDKG